MIPLEKHIVDFMTRSKRRKEHPELIIDNGVLKDTLNLASWTKLAKLAYGMALGTYVVVIHFKLLPILLLLWFTNVDLKRRWLVSIRCRWRDIRSYASCGSEYVYTRQYCGVNR